MADIFNLSDTWNDGGTVFDGIKLNVTNTASAAGSKLLDLQVGGASKFSVASDGKISTTASKFETSYHQGFDFALSGLSVVGIGLQYLGLTTNASLRWTGSTIDPTAIATLSLFQDAPNVLGQRNGVNAQTYNLYNTADVSLTNYERAHIGWNDTADIFVIGTEAAGTGLVRDIQLKGNVGIGTASPSDPLHVHGDSRFTTSVGIGLSISPGNASSRIGNTHANDDMVLATGKDLIFQCWDGSVFAERGRLSESAGLALVDSVGLHGVTPPAQAAHIADATDATDVITRVNAILVALENIGVTAAV